LHRVVVLDGREVVIEVSLETRLVVRDARAQSVELLEVGAREDLVARVERVVPLPAAIELARAPRLARVEGIDLRPKTPRTLLDGRGAR
jgi:hypothetical protein